jgi:hypothetical protein
VNPSTWSSDAPHVALRCPRAPLLSLHICMFSRSEQLLVAPRRRRRSARAKFMCIPGVDLLFFLPAQAPHPGLRGRGDCPQSLRANCGVGAAVRDARRREAESISFFRRSASPHISEQPQISARCSQPRLARRGHAEGILRKAVFTNHRSSMMMQFFTLLMSLRIPPN